MTEATTRKNYVRRIIGIVACSLPLVAAMVCAIWPRTVPPSFTAFGLVLAILSCLLGCLNLYLVFLRPWLYKRSHGNMEGYAFVSGIPLVGTILLVAGCIIAFGNTAVGILGLLAGLLDAGGLPWVPVLTWKDTSLWDG